MLLCVGLFTATACNTEVPELNGSASADYPFTVNGVTVQQAVARVAVYDDSLADVVMYLGSAYQMKLAARGSDCVHPDIQILPTAGTAVAPNVEQLKKLGVEILLMRKAPSEQIQKALEAEGIQILVCPEATDRNELIELYRVVASVLGGAKSGYKTGEKRANSLLMALDDIKRVVPQKDVLPIVVYVTDRNGTMATNQTMMGKLFEYVNATNAAGDQGSMEADELQLTAPNVIFCAEGLKSVLASHSSFATLQAVKDGKIIEVPTSGMAWQGSAMLNGVIRLAVELYPELKTEGLLPQEPPVSSNTASEPSSDRPKSVDANSSYEDILILQDRLIELGYMKPPKDGVYGYWTKACIKEFQRRAGLPQTGIADERTMDALYAEDAPKG